MKNECEHTCHCICHRQAGVNHIIACCLECPFCKKYIPRIQVTEHRKDCHGVGASPE